MTLNHLKKYAIPSPFVFTFSPKYFVEQHQCTLQSKAHMDISVLHKGFTLIQWKGDGQPSSTSNTKVNEHMKLYIHCYVNNNSYFRIPMEFHVEVNPPFLLPDDHIFKFKLNHTLYRIGWYVNFQSYKPRLPWCKSSKKGWSCHYGISFTKNPDIYPIGNTKLPSPNTPLLSDHFNFTSEHYVPGKCTTVGAGNMYTFKEIVANYKPIRNPTSLYFVLPSLKQFYDSDPQHPLLCGVSYTVPENAFSNLATYKMTLYVESYKDVFQAMLFTDSHIMLNKYKSQNGSFVNPYKYSTMAVSKHSNEFIEYTLSSTNDLLKIKNKGKWSYRAHEPITLVNFCQPDFLHAELHGLKPNLKYKCKLECCLVNDKKEYVTQYETSCYV